MNKTLKRLILILAIFILCGIMQFILVQKVEAAENMPFALNDETKIWGDKKEKPGQKNDVYITLEQFKAGTVLHARNVEILRYSYTYCVEYGQKFSATYDKIYNDLKIVATFTIDNGTVTRTVKDNKNLPGSLKIGTTSSTQKEIVDFAKGLAYILSFSSEDRWDSDKTREKQDIYQQALWKYLQDGYNNVTIRNFFCLPGNKKTPPHSTDSDNIYNKACEAKNASVSYNATIHVIANFNTTKTTDFNGQQWIWLVERATYKDDVPVELNFTKTDMSGSKLKNAKISVTANDNVASISGLKNDGTLTSDASGNFGNIKITPKSNTGTFKINVEEKQSPTGYKNFGNATLTVKYNTSTGAVTSITSSNTKNIPSTANKNVTVKNQPYLQSLTLSKSDSLTGKALKDATFRITLTNVESVKGYSGALQSGKIILSKTTDAQGNLKLEDLVFSGSSNQIGITIEETGVPSGNGCNYQAIKPITFNVKYAMSNGVATYSLVNPPSGVTISDNKISITAKDVPLINLSGIVWEDGQTGVKNVVSPNGNKDSSERGIDGVLVQLCKADTKQVVAETSTSGGGLYKFENVEKTNAGYIIVFNYDGINYIETRASGSTGADSKATEQNRSTFNNRFKTISKNQSNDGTPLTYDYNNNVSKLKVNIDGTNPASNDKDFRMKAQTGTYKDITTNIDCGLVKKELDLALGTDLVSARLEINDKSFEYSYNQVLDGALDDVGLDEILQGKSSENSEVTTYNLYLYQSDYNYRIADYKTDETQITDKVNSENPEGGYKATVGDENNDTIKELEAYVKYNVVLKNRTLQNASVDEFVYYYDEVYTPVKESLDKIEGYSYVIDENARKITFTRKDNESIITAPDYRVMIEIEFRINKDENGYILGIDETHKNIGEITRYSTYSADPTDPTKGIGLIDSNSAPDNGITDGKVTQYENDTDESVGLNISIKNEERIIEGTVFEDLNKNAQNDDNVQINDVIVQLVEVKKINGKYYEYIWQEARSGRTIVKTTARNGYNTTEDDYKQMDNGKYKFKGYIPGNYIVRYIYGDGSIENLTSEQLQNIQKYNGQDYKSTVDEKYNENWYSALSYETGKSIARDNEARRLEVMAYSTRIDKEIGNALANKSALDDTWMAAETSRIYVPIEEENSNPSPNNTVLFENMNFGLAKRPETRIELEKHITALRINTNGVGTQSIVDASADIEKIVNEDTIETKGITTGLATIKSTRENRGFWQVATDIEELAQGAELEVEYTYVIRNDSDEDYLSNTLVTAFRNQDTKPYNEVLAEVQETVKASMKNGAYSYDKNNKNNIGTYLGQFYYTGKKSDTDELVPTRIEANGLEEALNNSLRFEEAEDFTKINEEGENRKVFNAERLEQDQTIQAIVQNTTSSSFLTPKVNDKYTQGVDVDYSKKITLRTILSSTSGGEIGANLPSYIAEIVEYTNAAGRKDTEAIPANLKYVHSHDTQMTMASHNERDEFWGETIIITKPTGENKLSPLQIALITVSSIAVLGVGTLLIKKYAVKK